DQNEAGLSGRAHDIDAAFSAYEQRADRRQGDLLAADIEVHLARLVRSDIFLSQRDIAVGALDIAGLEVPRKKRFDLAVKFFKMLQPFIAVPCPIDRLRFGRCRLLAFDEGVEISTT